MTTFYLLVFISKVSHREEIYSFLKRLLCLTSFTFFLKRLEAPRAKWHNPSIDAGSFTHYGDQALVLLKTLEQKNKKFDLGAYWSDWKKFWEDGNPASARTYRDG